MVRTPEGSSSLFDFFNRQCSVVLVFTGDQDTAAIEKQWQEVDGLISGGYPGVVEAYVVTGQAISGSADVRPRILRDDTGEVHQRYAAAAHGELVLIRADGYIGFRGPSSAMPALRNYLRLLFGQ
jgi:hypothetical protein